MHSEQHISISMLALGRTQAPRPKPAKCKQGNADAVLTVHRMLGGSLQLILVLLIFGVLQAFVLRTLNQHDVWYTASFQNSAQRCFNTPVKGTGIDSLPAVGVGTFI